jgi:hypothetical protein
MRITKGKTLVKWAMGERAYDFDSLRTTVHFGVRNFGWRKIDQ